jgi:hypothetical protein
MIVLVMVTVMMEPVNVILVTLGHHAQQKNAFKIVMIEVNV